MGNMNQIYGRKLGMTRIFSEEGESIPVTILEVSPNVIYQVKTKEHDGYNALQVGIGTQKPTRVNKPLTGHLGGAKKGFPQTVREIRLADQEQPSEKVGDEIKLEGMFAEKSYVDVFATSIGKGFAGVLKRHKMAGFKATHGTHEYFRHGGSIGCRKFPGRVFKNKRMPGHMGNIRVMQLGLEVVRLRSEENLMFVRGSVPGPKNGVVCVRRAIKHH